MRKSSAVTEVCRWYLFKRLLRLIAWEHRFTLFAISFGEKRFYSSPVLVVNFPSVRGRNLVNWSDRRWKPVWYLGLSPDLQTMEQIRRIMRPTDVPDTGKTFCADFERSIISISFLGLLCDLLWYAVRISDWFFWSIRSISGRIQIKKLKAGERTIVECRSPLVLML